MIRSGDRIATGTIVHEGREYTKLEWIKRTALKNGTLASGEGRQLIEHYEAQLAAVEAERDALHDDLYAISKIVQGDKMLPVVAAVEGLKRQIAEIIQQGKQLATKYESLLDEAYGELSISRLACEQLQKQLAAALRVVGVVSELVDSYAIVETDVKAAFNDYRAAIAAAEEGK